MAPRHRSVVITGASSGIGLAAARALARAGDRVVLLGRNAGRLHRAVQSLARETGVEPDHYLADFAELDQVRLVARQIRAAYPNIDVLINNAGGLATVRRTTVDGLDRTMQVNHLGGFLLVPISRRSRTYRRD